MLNEKQSESSNVQEDSNEIVSKRPSIQILTNIEIDETSGFVCDINTGICGPVTEKKEGKK